MKKNLPDFADVFRDKIDAMDALLNKQIWENIEKHLDKDDADRYKRKYILLRNTSVCLMALFIGFAIFSWLHITSLNKYLQQNEISSTNNLKLYATDEAANSSVIKKHQTNTILVSKKKLVGDHSGSLWLSSSNKAINERLVVNKISAHKAQKVISTKISSLAEKNGALKPESSKALVIFPRAAFSQKNVAEIKTINKSNEETLLIAEGTLNTLDNRRASIFYESKVDATKQADVTDKKNVTVTSKVSRFSIGGFFAPEYIGYLLQNDETNSNDDKDQIDKRETSDFSFSTGITVAYAVNKHWSLESGLAFSSAGISISKSKIFAERSESGDVKFRYNTSTGYSYLLPSFNTTPKVGDSLSTGSSSLVLQYVGAPLILKYEIKRGKYKLAMGAGVSINALTKSFVETELADKQNKESETIDRFEGLRKINVGFVLSPEVQYLILPHWSVVARTYLKTSLIPINNGNIVRTFPYNIGLSAGLLYKL